ncbi:MAG: alpha/beta hydrolase-fold protein [Pseudomonadota bacterium]
MRNSVVAVLLLFIGTSALAEESVSGPAGQIERVVVAGKSLAGNLSGDPAQREVLVYTPPGYAADARHRYPVVYFLHGYGVTAQFYANTLNWPTAIDRAINDAHLQKMIVVMPDAFTPFGGSMYSNSVTTGNWESFVARDLVGYVDSHYRTIAKREARGLSGHSMGGYGTLRIGMKYPDAFAALYAMSACCLDPRGVSPVDAALEKISKPAEVAAMPSLGRTTLAASAAWAPDAKRPPFFLDLPTTNGVTQKDVIARYAANAPPQMLSKYAKQLKRYAAIAMDVGTKDSLIGGNAAMDKALTLNGVKHTYQTYDGDHVNRIAQRFETQVLPFFSEQLKAK